MPRLPVYSSSEGLTTRQPEVTRSGAGGTARELSKVFGAMADIAVRWKIAEEEMQNTSLLARQTELSARIQMEAETDNDIQGGADRKKVELKRGTDALLEEVKNPFQRERLAIQMHHNATIDSIKLDNVYRKKKIAEFQGVAMPKVLNGIMQQKANNPDHNSTIWKQADKTLKDNIRKWIALGLITPETGAETLADERKMVALNEIMQDPKTALSNLKNKSWNKELTLEERQDLIKKAEQQIEANKKKAEALKEEAKAQQEAKWYSADGLAIQDYISGQATAEEIESLAISGKVSPQTGKAIASVSWSKFSPNAKTDNKVYNKLLREYYDIDDSDYEKVREWRTSVLAAHASKNMLDKKDTLKLIQMSIIPLEAKPTLKAKKSLIGEAIRGIGDYTTLIIDDPMRAISENRIVHSLFRNLTGIDLTFENVEKAKNEAIAEEQKRNNPNRGRYELNKPYTTAKGNTFIVTGYDTDGEPIIEVQE